MARQVGYVIAIAAVILAGSAAISRAAPIAPLPADVVSETGSSNLIEQVWWRGRGWGWRGPRPLYGWARPGWGWRGGWCRWHPHRCGW